MNIAVNGPMQEMMRVGLARLARSKRYGTRGTSWRMCMCGQEFFAVGRKRKVMRRLAEQHIQACRAKARAKVMAGHG